MPLQSLCADFDAVIEIVSRYLYCVFNERNLQAIMRHCFHRNQMLQACEYSIE